MRSTLASLAVLGAILASPAHGEVVESTDSGFLVRHTAGINGSATKVYAALTEGVGNWWDKVHTWSHDSHNLRLDPKPGGCFCERLPDGGGVQHMTVVYASPGKLLRLSGALGPMQDSGLAGSLTWTLTEARGATNVELTYSVGGFRAGGLRGMAPAVDGVLRGQ
ncbi:MAG TPA: SRPBCC domain-containing protein, partial [Vicinamibacterales bacterium]|nr:SRPBCC domain-containing protein [Vicinamibacterales bacterium]